MVEAVEFNEGGAVQGYAHGGFHGTPVKTMPIPMNVQQLIAQGQEGSVPRPDLVRPDQADDPYTSDEIPTLTPITDVNDPRVMGQEWYNQLPGRDEGAGFTIAPSNRIGMSEKALLEETGAERLQRLFPVEFASSGRQDLERDPTKADRERKSRIGAFVTGAFSKVKDATRSIGSEVGQDFVAAADTFLADAESDLPRGMFGDPDSVDMDMIARRRTVMEMIQRRPDLKDDIIAASVKVLDENKDITADTRSPGGIGDSTLGANDFAQAIATTISQDREFVPSDLTGTDRSGPEDDLDRTAREQFEDPTGPDQEEKSFADLFEGDVERGLTAAEKTETAVKKAKETDTSAEFAKDDPFLAAEFETEDLSDAEGSGKRSVSSLLQSGIDDVVREAEKKYETGEISSSEEKSNVKKGLKDFIKDFKENISAYDGMSDSEKGFAIMEAGLKIMAGQSPHALVNIAEGLKGLGPQFAKDAKEKRAWDRQIELSALKYGMQKIDKIETEERKLATTTEKLIATGPGSYELPNGKIKTYDEGEIVFLPKSITLEKGVPKNLIDPTTRGIQITAAATKAKALASAQSKLREELIVSDAVSLKAKKSFMEASDKVVLGHEIKALIENSFDLSGKATGANNYGKELIFKALSATGYRPEWLLGEGTEAEKEAHLVEKFGGRSEYNQQMQEVANRLLKRLLGEGSKNISNVDRALAQEISGLVKDFATGLYTNPTLLRKRLRRVLDMANSDISQGQTEMKNLFDEYSTRIQPGMPVSNIQRNMSYSHMVLGPLAKQSLVARQKAKRTSAQQNVFGSIPGFTFNEKTGQYDVGTK